MIGNLPSGRPNFDRDAQLRQLGVTETELLDALSVGNLAAARCTRNHPPIAAGFYRFAESVAALAETKAPEGWTRNDYKNFSTIVRPGGKVAIAIASGSEGTGDLSAEVTTRCPKGRATSEAIDMNLVLPLDERYVSDNERIMQENDEADDPCATWFLLHDRREGMMYAELSLPKSISASGFVEEWFPRIPLTPRALDGATPLIVPEAEPPVIPIVNIKKRDS